MVEVYYNGQQGEWRSGPYHADENCPELDQDRNIRATLPSAVEREDDPEWCPECAGEFLPSGSGPSIESEDSSASGQEIVLEADESAEAAPFDPGEHTVSELEDMDLSEYSESSRRALLEAERAGEDRTTAIEVLGRNVPDGDEE